jgi:hypothetical protein
VKEVAGYVSSFFPEGVRVCADTMIIDLHHTSAELSNSSETARTSVHVSWRRRGSVLSVVRRRRLMSCSVSLLSREELVIKSLVLSRIHFNTNGCRMDRWERSCMNEGSWIKLDGCLAS